VLGGGQTKSQVNHSHGGGKPTGGRTKSQANSHGRQFWDGCVRQAGWGTTTFQPTGGQMKSHTANSHAGWLFWDRRCVEAGFGATTTQPTERGSCNGNFLLGGTDGGLQKGSLQQNKLQTDSQWVEPGGVWTAAVPGAERSCKRTRMAGQGVVQGVGAEGGR
jgi:hypothetical protein